MSGNPVKKRGTTRVPESASVSAGPVTAGPVTAGSVSAGPVTAAPVTAGPVTAGPATAAPPTAVPARRRIKPAASSPLSKLKVWVLYPQLITDDPNLQYYYDFSQSLKEYTEVFAELQVDWSWEPVTTCNYKQLIAGIRKRSGRKVPLVLNLCDGDEVNGVPGVSVIHELERCRVIYTGASAFFYDITTSKVPMKRAFDRADVSTAAWEVVGEEHGLVPGLCERLGGPVLIKPAVSGGSMGVSVKNVVTSDQQCRERVAELSAGYRGWDLLAGGLIAERFVTGPEFTTLIVGSGDKAYCYPPVERVFHHTLPEAERFLSFDRLWEIYEHEHPMPGNANFYEYAVPAESLIPQIMELSLQAYAAVGGTGYGRLDLRLDQASGQLYVLEVNAQCGLSEDENYTSIGAILRFSGHSFTDLIFRVIRDAFHRRSLLL